MLCKNAIIVCVIKISLEIITTLKADIPWWPMNWKVFVLDLGPFFVHFNAHQNFCP